MWQAIVSDDTKLEKVRAISSEWRKYETLFSIWLSRGQANSRARQTFSVIAEQRQNLKQIDEPHIYSVNVSVCHKHIWLIEVNFLRCVELIISLPCQQLLLIPTTLASLV